MLKCPYCYEALSQLPSRCPHCSLFIIDTLIDVDFPSLDKKDCVYCGKKILKEARYCRHCHKWLDELNQLIRDIDWDD